MPRQLFALEPDGVKRLELTWSGYWKDFKIILDGKPIGVIQKVKTLTHGCDIQLPDGSVLGIKLDRKLLGRTLILLRDGQPVPGSATSPQRAIKIASDTVYFISGMSLGLVLIAEFFHVQLLLENGIGYVSMIMGFIFLPLAYYTHEGSRLALGLADILIQHRLGSGFYLQRHGGNHTHTGHFYSSRILDPDDTRDGCDDILETNRMTGSYNGLCAMVAPDGKCLFFSAGLVASPG